MAGSSPDQPWRRCYEQLAPKLLLFARQWLSSSADAEDAVQAGFVKFWQHQPEAKPEHYPLLYAAVRSAALDFLRSHDRRLRREAAACELVEDRFFDVPIERREQADTLEAALRKLSAEQREVLVLRIWGELTFAEIATALDASINTITSRYRHALEALRRLLRTHEYERV
ncbi:MAG: sigma-70 family RNA polymerase sigma factor [Verrucomicrobiota bacterium]|nr:sigma-70 family RNA polymerase sigma factor [Verrucomicrobiota bacterium]